MNQLSNDKVKYVIWIYLYDTSYDNVSRLRLVSTKQTTELKTKARIFWNQTAQMHKI